MIREEKHKHNKVRNMVDFSGAGCSKGIVVIYYVPTARLVLIKPLTHIFILFYRFRNWGKKKLSKLLKLTQWVSDGGENWT